MKRKSKILMIVSVLLTILGVVLLSLLFLYDEDLSAPAPVSNLDPAPRSLDVLDRILTDWKLEQLFSTFL